MFPFNLPAPTAFYLVLYLGTLVLHVLPMAYVVAGSALLMMRVLTQPRLIDNPLTLHLRQWLPFVLSAAITAGVAPLLFLQILYQREFYTANLLLFNRWMAILPVLIAGFYMLYLLKGNWLWRRHFLWRALVVLLVFACFAFVGWSWTENHLLSLAGQSTWTSQYTGNRPYYLPAEIFPRLGIWLCGVFPIMTAIVAWPLSRELLPAGTARRLALIALTGIIFSLSCGIWYLSKIDETAREQVLSTPYRAYQIGILFGIALQTAGWLLTWRSDALSQPTRLITLSGAVLSVAGVVACREAIRLSRLDLASLLPRHSAAFTIDGFWLFAIFLVLNALAIAACIAVVARNLRTEITDH
jgi:hypothetical protein